MNRAPHILLIAGSAEAHEIAAAMAGSDVSARAVLRRTERSFGPLAVPSEIWSPRTVDEMAAYLHAHEFTAVLDAGHGFDADISQIAFDATARLGLPYLRVLRPMWDISAPVERAASVAAAARMIRPQARVFAATGRGTVADYALFAGARLYLRQTNAQARTKLPPFAEAVYGQPPFTQAAEEALFRALQIDTLVLRNVGGVPSRPKLDAARALGLRVIAIDRPAAPVGAQVVAAPDSAINWVETLTTGGTAG
tara:strand:+ start:166 stop:924 length:759 start_codon:yes stop_codon:yes gene_type:complete